MTSHARHCQDPECAKPATAERWVKIGEQVKVKAGPGDWSPKRGVVVSTYDVGFVPKCFYASVKDLGTWGPYYLNEQFGLWDFADEPTTKSTRDATIRRNTIPAPAPEHADQCDGTDCDYDYCQAQGAPKVTDGTKQPSVTYTVASDGAGKCETRIDGMTERERGAWEMYLADTSTRSADERCRETLDELARVWDNHHADLVGWAEAQRQRDEASAVVERLTKERDELARKLESAKDEGRMEAFTAALDKWNNQNFNGRFTAAWLREKAAGK